MVNFLVQGILKVKGHLVFAHFEGSGGKLVKELRDQWYMETACSAARLMENRSSRCPAD